MVIQQLLESLFFVYLLGVITGLGIGLCISFGSSKREGKDEAYNEVLKLIRKNKLK